VNVPKGAPNRKAAGPENACLGFRGEASATQPARRGGRRMIANQKVSEEESSVQSLWEAAIGLPSNTAEKG